MYGSRIVSNLTSKGYTVISQDSGLTILNKKEQDYYKVVVIINNYGGKITASCTLDVLRKKLDMSTLFIHDCPHRYLFILTHYDKRGRYRLRERNVIYCEQSGKTIYNPIDQCFKEDLTEFRLDRKYMETERKQISKRNEITNITLPVVSIIMAVICLYLFFTGADVALYGISPEGFMKEGRFHTILTYMFLHDGILHLIGNMISLLVFGVMLEKRLGHIKYFLLCIFSGIYAGLASTFLKWESGEVQVITVGLSGVLYAVMGAMLIYQLHEKRNVTLLAIYAAASLFSGFYKGRVDNGVHIAGILFGSCQMIIYILLSKLYMSHLVLKTLRMKRMKEKGN